MKKIFRMIIFSGIALYLTSLWNKGFILNLDLVSFLKTSIIIAVVYYFVVPFSKIIFLPLNIITFGLVSTIFYGLLFYFLFKNLDFISVKAWHFGGGKFLNFIIIPIDISYIVNIFLSAFSISTIINLLEKIL